MVSLEFAAETTDPRMETSLCERLAKILGWPKMEKKQSTKAAENILGLAVRAIAAPFRGPKRYCTPALPRVAAVWLRHDEHDHDVIINYDLYFFGQTSDVVRRRVLSLKTHHLD